MLDPAQTLAVISIGIGPEIHIGPITLAWHGLTIAIGIVIAGIFPAARYARERGLDTEELYNVGIVLGISGIVGARALYVIEKGDILRPGEWLGTRGFSFNGALILAAVAIAAYLRFRRLGVSYLDVIAVAFPLGIGIGRIGDIINGEHYGPPSNLPWAVRNTNPNADVPDPSVAYHSGGLYESVLGLAIFAIVWPLRHRFRRPTEALWTVIALYTAGRFVVSFYRSDREVALGLTVAQWTSLGVFVVAIVGLTLVRLKAMREAPRAGANPSPAPRR